MKIKGLYFAENFSQLPLSKGDGAFFNPAVLHAAGTNQTKDFKRMANLTQIGSAFGRTLETVDREQLSNAIYPVLRSRKAEGWSESELKTVVAASAEAERPYNLVCAMMNLAHTMGLEVVAEGIETTEQAQKLKDAGCRFGQGYLFSPPITIPEVANLLLKTPS